MSPPALTQDQYDKLLNLLQNTSITQPSTSGGQVNVVTQYRSPSFEKPNSGISHSLSSLTDNCSNIWIVDSSASDHICFSLKCFTNYEPIKPVNIKPPNGHFLVAKIARTLQFSFDFTVTNVLYVPDFSFNLISVSKLIQALNYMVTFVDEQCEIQDLKARKMIGSTELFEGLYYLKMDSRKVNSTRREEEDAFYLPQAALWHFRLRHLSNKEYKNCKLFFLL